MLKEIFLIIFLQSRFYPDVEFYDEKIGKNIYLTDIKEFVRGRAFISYNIIKLHNFLY